MESIMALNEPFGKPLQILNDISSFKKTISGTEFPTARAQVKRQ
jgi:hypothetical protein